MQFQKYLTIRYTRKISRVVSEYKLWQLRCMALVSLSSFSVTKGLGNALFAGAELHSKREEVRKTKQILLEAKIAKWL